MTAMVYGLFVIGVIVLGAFAFGIWMNSFYAGFSFGCALYLLMPYKPPTK